MIGITALSLDRRRQSAVMIPAHVKELDATHITLGGHYAYVAADAGVIVLDLNDPLKPRVMQVLPAKGARASALQFRYLWVADEDGVKLFDITKLG